MKTHLPPKEKSKLMTFHFAINKISNDFPTVGSLNCESCGKSFEGKHAKRSLNNHMKTHQVQEIAIQDYTCHFCNRDYKTKPNLKKHKDKYCKEFSVIRYPLL